MDAVNSRTESLESLLVATNRVIRLAAQTTGSTVSSAVWTTLSVLESDGPHRVGDLARVARISQPGMTKVLHGLVEDEWVLRIADVEDSRAWLIAVTDKGRGALADWRTQLADATSEIFHDLTEAEWATLTNAAAILGARLNKKAAVA